MGLTTFEVSRGFTYSYTHIKPADGALKPCYVLFLHGFPAFSSIWQRQIDYFGNLGYGVIAPDLLGYGKTSCPSSVSSYRFKFMAQDVIEILNKEDIEAVHAVGHDWGVMFLSRLEFYFPERIIKMALIGTAYVPPGQTFDLDTLNAVTKEKFGYSAYGYLNFFTQNPDAVSLLDSHKTSFASLVYASDPAIWKVHFGPLGALEKWLQNDMHAELGSWVSEKYMTTLDQSLTRNGGYAGPLNWCLSLLSDLNNADVPDGTAQTYSLKRPVLLLAAEIDPIVPPEQQIESTGRYASDLTAKQISCGHWVMIEAPVEVNTYLRDFIAGSRDRTSGR